MNEDIDSNSVILEVASYLRQRAAIDDAEFILQWRLLQTAHYYLSLPNGKERGQCLRALRAFTRWHDRNREERPVVESSLRAAMDAARSVVSDQSTSILPQLPPHRRQDVQTAIDVLCNRGISVIGTAIECLSAVGDRLQASSGRLVLAGVRKRFTLLRDCLLNERRPDNDRMLAAAAILYLHEINDVVSDSFGLIGLLDDDYALRYVLRERLGFPDEALIHWAERICSIWDDLPFLQGLHLQRNDNPIAHTWLDRIVAYTAYQHALESRSPLIIGVPERVFDPLETIIVLLGLLLLESLTAEPPARKFKPNGLYCIDGKFYARFVDYQKNLIRFRFGCGSTYGVPVALENRVAECSAVRKESTLDSFRKSFKFVGEPIQRFFGWGAEIGGGRLTAKIAIVTTHRAALDVMGDVASNGVSLLGDGLVQLLGAEPYMAKDLISPVLIVPNLRAVRTLIDMGIELHTVLVDGYQRFKHSENDYWFIKHHSRAPRIVAWAPMEDVPDVLPEWADGIRAEIPSREDLAEIVELEEQTPKVIRDSVRVLRMLSLPAQVSLLHVSRPVSECNLVLQLNALIDEVHEARDLPTSWYYLLASYATDLRRLIASTATTWTDIQEVATAQASNLISRAGLMPKRFAHDFGDLFERLQIIERTIAQQPDEPTSLGKALMRCLGEHANQGGYVAYGKANQVIATDRLLRDRKLQAWSSRLVTAIPSCSRVVIPGWQTRAFLNGLWAAAPENITLLGDDREQRIWRYAIQWRNNSEGKSMIASPNMLAETVIWSISDPDLLHDEEEALISAVPMGYDESSGSMVNAVGIWCSTSASVAIIGSRGRVIVNDNGTPVERDVTSIRAGDTVLLMQGTNALSPADEFVESLVRSIREHWPERVSYAREWRYALERYMKQAGMDVEALRRDLARAGVERERQTIEGWLKLDRAAPIAPRGMQSELMRIWLRIEPYSKHPFNIILESCEWLRRLRYSAERALFNHAHSCDVDGIDGHLIQPVIARLQQEVVQTDVVMIDRLHVPKELVGCWVPIEIVRLYAANVENETHRRSPAFQSKPTT